MARWQRVQRERYAYIGEYIGVLADLSRFDSVYFAPDSFQMGAYGIAMRKGLGITKPVNLLWVLSVLCIFKRKECKEKRA